MTTYSWIAGDNGDWSVASDWNVDAVPNSSAAVVTIAATGNTVTIGSGEAFTIGSLALNAGTLIATGVLQGGSITVGGGTLGLGANFTYSGNFSETGGLIQLDGHTLTLSGNAYFLDYWGSDYSYPSSADTGIEGGGSLVTSGTLTLANTSYALLLGALSWTNSGVVNDGGGIGIGDAVGSTVAIVNQAGAAFNLTTDSSSGIYNHSYSITTYDSFGNPITNSYVGSSTFINAGLLARTGGTATGISRIYSNVTDTGTITSAIGTLEFDGGGTFSGPINGAGTVAFGGGTATIEAGASLTAAGLVVSNGTLGLGANASYSGNFGETGGLIQLDGNTLTLSGNAYFLDYWSTSVSYPPYVDTGIEGSGTLVSSGTLTIANSYQALQLSGLSWTNLGVVNDGGEIGLGAPAGSTVAIVNQAGATFNLTADSSGIENRNYSVTTYDSFGNPSTNYYVGSSTFINAGLLARTGGTATGSSHIYSTVTDTGTITSAIGTLEFDGGGTFSGPINGAGTVAFGSGTGTLEAGASLSAGRLVIDGGVLVTVGTVTTTTPISITSGTLDLSGGSVQANSIAIAAFSSVGGFGTLAASLANLGTIDASGGLLKINGSITGGGTLRIETGATLELNTPTAEGVYIAGANAELLLDTPSAYIGTISNFTPGDTLALGGLTASGAVLNNGTMTVTIASGGTISYLVPGGFTNELLKVAVNAGTTYITPLDRPAVASGVPTSPIALGSHHVGDIVTDTLSITNTALNDGHSEALDASIGSPTTGVTATGSFAGLAAGQTNSTALVVGLNTANSGTISGTATISFETDGTGLDGQAPAALPSQTVSVTGTIYNYATASIQELSGSGSLVQNGNSYLVNFGTVIAGSTAPSVHLEILNTAQGLADVLSGSLQASGTTGFTNTGLGVFSGEGAGQADTAPTVTLSTANAGSFSETITLTATGSDPSGYSGSLAQETVTIIGAVTPAGTAVTWRQDVSGDWANPNDWSSLSLPSAAASVTIDYADLPEILHETGIDTVFSLTNTAGDFQMAGGSLTAGAIENDSIMGWTGGSLVLQGGTLGGPTLLNKGTLSITANGQRLSAIGTGPAILTNAGTIRSGGSGTASLDAGVVNTGSIVVTSGTLALDGGGTANGAGLVVGPDGTLQFGLPASGSGGDFVVTGGQYAVGNTVVDGGTLDVSAASSVFFVDSLRVAGAGTLLLGAQNATAQNGFVQGPTAWAGATGTPFLSGSSTFTVFGGAALINGTESGPGLTRLFGSNQLGGSGGSFDLDGGRTVENDGWMTWSAGSIVLGAGDASAVAQSGTISNVAGATFYVTANGRIANQGTGALDNSGVMAVFAGTGETDIDATLVNPGDIQVQSGTLSLNGGGSSAGSHLYVGNNAVMQFGTLGSGAAGGTFSITSGQYTAGLTFITGGTLDVSAASAAVFVDELKVTAGLLQLGASSAAQVQGALAQSGGEIKGSGAFAVFGGASLMGGVQSGAAITRLFGTSVLGGGFALDGGRTLENDGWMNWSSGNIALGSGDASAVSQTGTISNVSGAVFYVTADARIGTAGPGSGTFDNAGVVAVFAGAGETDIDAYVANTGGLQVQSGTLGLNGGGSSSAAALFVGANAVVQFGTQASSGTGGTFTFTGGPYVASNTVVNGSTVDLTSVSGVSFGTSLTVSSGGLLLGTNFPIAASFAQSGGTLSGAGILTVTAAAQLDGGLETGSGRTDLADGGSIGGSVAFDGGRSLENDGTLTWSGGSITLGGGDATLSSHSATLINTAGALLAIETAGTLSSAGTGTISNSGTILSSGVGTTTLAANLFNFGTVDVTAGTLVLSGGVGGSGTFLVDGAATMDFVYGAGSSNAMRFMHSGGTLEVNASGLFAPAVSGFSTGDEIDSMAVLSSLTPSYVFNAGTLTVTDGVHSAAFALSGTFNASAFHLASDGHGGTAVTYG